MAPLDDTDVKTLFPRGLAGHTPALARRADEAYLDFVSDARNALLHARGRAVSEVGEQALAAAERATGRRPNSVDGVKAVILADPHVATYLRVKRSLQEAYWQRIEDSFGGNAAAMESALAAAETRGPGSVRWDPAFVYPDYATVDIHIQPGGYTAKPLLGLTYDYGTKVFFGGANDDDALHHRMAAKTAVPKDGTVRRALEIGCSIGQFACGLKLRFPDAEVWGTDISAPMVRYAHWRTMQQGLDVHYAQMPAEDLDFPDGHFDLVVEHLMFHETPVPVIERVLAEVKRVLRPGGTFVVWDFHTARGEKTGYASFLGMMDAADNGEPYATGFVACDIERLMTDAGFGLRSHDPEVIARDGRIGDKPLARTERPRS
jgi:SAM-dependent methyltransferase